MMSLAGMANEALAKAVLCISAVEMLAPDRAWTTNEQTFLHKVHDEAKDTPALSPDEQENVAKALKAVFGSIRQRIKCLILHDLSLGEETWKAFDKVYTERSKVLHGAAEFDRARHRMLASDASDVCRVIVDAAVRRSIQL